MLLIYMTHVVVSFAVFITYPLSVQPFSAPHLSRSPTNNKKCNYNILDKYQSAGRRTSCSHLFSSMGGNFQGEQAVEALRSLVDFHEGRWKGRARSFSVVADTAAGIIQRKKFPEIDNTDESKAYEVSVKLGLNEDRDYSLTETFAWNDEKQTKEANKNEDSNSKVKSRSLALSDCSIDVDAVDASYSLDFSLPDLPADIVGTDKLCQFAMEHCISASEDKRVRCFVLYDMEQCLHRVVVCEETRVKEETQSSLMTANSQNDEGSDTANGNQLTARDLIEMQNDVDRLVDKISANIDNGQSSSSNVSADSDVVDDVAFEKLSQSMTNDKDDSGSRPLTLHDMSLLETSSGIWLGDVIIRNNPGVADGRNSATGRGFGANSDRSTPSEQPSFASWSVGVQKVAWRLMWNFGDEIRQVVDAGKAMGDSLAHCLSTGAQPGTVCVNEGLSRRMPKDERMVYIDWASSTSVGFLVGPTMIQVPRYLKFDYNNNPAKSFYTEFALCQSTESGVDATPSQFNEIDMDKLQLPELCLSKMSRVYNDEGILRQGCTSFYNFKRFGVDDEDEDLQL